MPRVCRHVLVSGRVQGVGFRWHARGKAEELGLAGWVRNLPDGRVEVWMEGEEQDVQTLRTWLQTGPPAAKVTGVEEAERPLKNLSRFDVRRGLD